MILEIAHSKVGLVKHKKEELSEILYLLLLEGAYSFQELVVIRNLRLLSIQRYKDIHTSS